MVYIPDAPATVLQLQNPPTLTRLASVVYFCVSYDSLHGDTAVQFDGSRNADGLKYFATKGWASQEQLSYWNSPFSIM